VSRPRTEQTTSGIEIQSATGMPTRQVYIYLYVHLIIYRPSYLDFIFLSSFKRPIIKFLSTINVLKHCWWWGKQLGEGVRREADAGSSAVFCDVTPCKLMEVYWRVRGKYCLHFEGRRAVFPLGSCWFPFWFPFQPCRWGQYIVLKRQETSATLHGVTPQEILLFVVSANRT
jgi:hypothetical protein